MSLPDDLAQLPGPILSRVENRESSELGGHRPNNQEMPCRLMSETTVDNHLSNIFQQNRRKNRVALLNWAMDHGKICADGLQLLQPSLTSPA